MQEKRPHTKGWHGRVISLLLLGFVVLNLVIFEDMRSSLRGLENGTIFLVLFSVTAVMGLIWNDFASFNAVIAVLISLLVLLVSGFILLTGGIPTGNGSADVDGFIPLLVFSGAIWVLWASWRTMRPRKPTPAGE